MKSNFPFFRLSWRRGFARLRKFALRWYDRIKVTRKKFLCWNYIKSSRISCSCSIEFARSFASADRIWFSDSRPNKECSHSQGIHTACRKKNNCAVSLPQVYTRFLSQGLIGVCAVVGADVLEAFFVSSSCSFSELSYKNRKPGFAAGNFSAVIIQPVWEGLTPAGRDLRKPVTTWIA